MMMSTGIVTDSTSDLLPELQQRYGLGVVPLIVNWDGQTFRDRLDLSTTDFYNRLRTSKSLPKTGAPSLAAFEAAFREQLKQHEAVISVNLAASLSANTAITPSQLAGTEPGPPLVSNGIALKLAALDSAPGGQINGLSFTQYFGSLVTRVGNAVSNATTAATAQKMSPRPPW